VPRQLSHETHTRSRHLSGIAGRHLTTSSWEVRREDIVDRLNEQRDPRTATGLRSQLGVATVVARSDPSLPSISRHPWIDGSFSRRRAGELVVHKLPRYAQLGPVAPQADYLSPPLLVPTKRLAGQPETCGLGGGLASGVD
jgi:hypothetical protein